jgi:CBS domain-containing protein
MRTQEHETDRGHGGVAATSPSSPVSAISTAVPEVAGSRPLSEAAALMEEANVPALLVVPDSGVVTERDIARGMAAGLGRDDAVAALDATAGFVIDGATPVAVAAELMLVHEVSTMVVRLEGGTLGVVSLHDVVAVLLQHGPELWLTSTSVAIEDHSEVWIG